MGRACSWRSADAPPKGEADTLDAGKNDTASAAPNANPANTFENLAIFSLLQPGERMREAAARPVPVFRTLSYSAGDKSTLNAFLRITPKRMMNPSQAFVGHAPMRPQKSLQTSLAGQPFDP
jgi:hypothetical protein